MPLFIIELNDCEIRVADGARIILRSPGVVVLDREAVHVGEEAVKKAYLNPRATYNRYWHKLNQDALPVTTRRFRHHADLVYTHLLKLHEQAGAPEEFLFAVPGSYSGEQLAMLLGIAGACPFAAVGLVDAAVAATAAAAAAGEYQHLELHLHQTVITRLNVTDHVSRVAVETVAEHGLDKIYATAAGLIADVFIQQSRFDPLHHAETEQSLYDQLPALLRTLHHDREMQLEIRHRNTTHHAKLTRDALLAGLQPVYAKIHEYIAPDAACLIGDRLADLPGFTDGISDYEIIRPEAVFESCWRHASRVRSPGPELSFITALPAAPAARPAKPPVTRPAPDEPARARVTHVLYRHQAYPIGEESLYLSGDGQITREKTSGTICRLTRMDGVASLTVTATAPVRVNDRPINGSLRLQAGDRLLCGTGPDPYLFISVRDDHGQD